jgi:uncharacterized protein YpmB
MKEKNLNLWFIALVVFVVVWISGVFIYNSKDKRPSVNSTNEIAKPMLEQKDSYKKMDFVIINYFFVTGLVVDRQGNNYTIIYKDRNRVLQKVIVPKELLLSPTSEFGEKSALLFAP